MCDSGMHTFGSSLEDSADILLEYNMGGDWRALTIIVNQSQDK